MPNREDRPSEQLGLELPRPLEWNGLRVLLGSRLLTTTEKVVLWRIWSFDGRRFGRQRACYASLGHLADECGLPLNTVKRVMKELTYLGLVRSRPHGRGRLRTITIPDDAHPRSADADDLIRARQILDNWVETSRNEIAHQRRKEKRHGSLVSPHTGHQRPVHTECREREELTPLPPPDGGDFDRGGEPRTLRDIYRGMGS